MAKRAKQAVRTSGAKRLSETPAQRPRLISYRFAKLDHEQWPLHAVTAVKHQDVLRKLGDIETSTFDELSGHRSCKFIPTENLAAEAQRRLEDLELDDYDGLWEMTIQGEERVWGFRDDSVMLLLWWDPHHDICPSNVTKARKARPPETWRSGGRRH